MDRIVAYATIANLFKMVVDDVDNGDRGLDSLTLTDNRRSGGAIVVTTHLKLDKYQGDITETYSLDGGRLNWQSTQGVSK